MSSNANVRPKPPCYKHISNTVPPEAPACQAAVKTWNNTVVHPPPTVSYDSYPTYVGQTLCQDDRSPPALFYATNLYQCTLCIEQPSEDHSVSSQIRSFFNGVDPNGFPGWCGGNLVFTGTEKDLDTFTTSMYDFGIRMGFPLDLPFGTLATDNPAGLLWPTPIRANRPT